MNNCEQVLENELNNSHANTSSIRALFFEKYKKEIYKNLTKDIDLNIKFIPNSYDSKFPNYFDIGDNFLNQLGKFRIETESVPSDGLSPDFIIDQVSTELGKFHIKSIGIYIQDKFNITVDEFNSGNIKTKLKIFEKKFPRKILDENGVVCEEDEDEDEDEGNDTDDDDDDKNDDDKDDFKEKT
ncbi:unnamed protein product [[Candida] boidinii]|nr:unnamed protein product [[Candida] boidinii]